MPRKATPLGPLSVAGLPNAEHQALLLEKGEALHGPLALLGLTPVPWSGSGLSAVSAKARLSRPNGASERKFLCLLCFVHRGSGVLEEGLYCTRSTSSLTYHLKRVHKEDLVIRQVAQRERRTKWPSDVLAQGCGPEDWQLAPRKASTERKDYTKRKTGAGDGSGDGQAALPKADYQSKVNSQDAAKTEKAAAKEARRRTAWEIQRASLRRLKERGIDVTELDVKNGKVFRILPWAHEGLCAFGIKGRLTSTDQRQRELVLQDGLNADRPEGTELALQDPMERQDRSTLTSEDRMGAAAIEGSELASQGAAKTALACLVCLERRGFVAKLKGLFDGAGTGGLWGHVRSAHGEELARLEAQAPAEPATRRRRRRKPSCLVELDQSGEDIGDTEAAGHLTSPLKDIKEQGKDADWRGMVELDQPIEEAGHLPSLLESFSPPGCLAESSLESAETMSRVFTSPLTSGPWRDKRQSHPALAASLWEGGPEPEKALFKPEPEPLSEVSEPEEKEAALTFLTRLMDNVDDARSSPHALVNEDNARAAPLQRALQLEISAKEEFKPNSEENSRESLKPRKVYMKTQCPLCSAKVPPEGLEEHVKLEMNYFPVRCTLCGCKFLDWAAADKHFQGRFSRHPGQAPELMEARDLVKERRIEKLLELA